jgi:hypothetical protein
MPNQDEITIKLDAIDVAFLRTIKEIDGDTIEEKLASLISAELQRLAEQFVDDC